MSLIFGLSAALAWGLAEFMTRHATRKLGWVRALIGVQLCGLFCVGALLLWQRALPAASSQIWLIMMGLALCNAIANLLIYRAFEIGNLSIVSPLAAGYAVVTALLSLLHGDRPAAVALAGAALLIVGVMVIALHRDAECNANDEVKDAASCGTEGGTCRTSAWAGMPQALGSAVGFGMTFWGLGFVTPALGVAWSLFVLRSVTALAACIGLAYGFMRGGFAAAMVVPVALPPGVPAMPSANAEATLTSAARPSTASPFLRACLKYTPVVVGIMAADTAGWLAFNAGVRTNSAAIVTALASLASAVTVLLACVFLRERLATPQWAGVAAILLGVFLVSLP